MQHKPLNILANISSLDAIGHENFAVVGPSAHEVRKNTDPFSNLSRMQ